MDRGPGDIVPVSGETYDRRGSDKKVDYEGDDPEEYEMEQREEEQRSFLLHHSSASNHTLYPPRIPALPHIVSPAPNSSVAGKEEVKGPSSPLSDLRNLLIEVRMTTEPPFILFVTYLYSVHHPYSSP